MSKEIKIDASEAKKALKKCKTSRRSCPFNTSKNHQREK